MAVPVEYLSCIFRASSQSYAVCTTQWCRYSATTQQLPAPFLLDFAKPARHPPIPELHDYGRTRYIRGTTVDVPAVASSPKGRQALVGLNREQLQALLTDILSALEFAHGKGVFHLDVCGRNIDCWVCR